MRRIESQREQWPHRIALHRLADPHPLDNNSATGTTFTDSTKVTGTEGMSGLEAGTALGVGSARDQKAESIAQSAAGKPYEYGGSGPGSLNHDGKPAKSWDCSGLAGDLYSATVGLDPNARQLTDNKGERFNTTSDMAAMGFQRGSQPGTLNIGLNPSEGSAGHMDVQLPSGQRAESSGRDGVEYGNGARQITDKPFTEQWHLPDATQMVVNQMNAVNKTSQRRQAVPEHPSRRYLDKLMEHIEQNGWGGMTVKKVPGDAPKSGYMVSIKGTENKIPLDDLSGKALKEFMEKWHPLINAHPEHYMGGWQEGRDWYNDVSRRHDHARGLGPAARDAFQNDQLALYDLDNDRAISTDEAGWMTGAPWKVGHHE